MWPPSSETLPALSSAAVRQEEKPEWRSAMTHSASLDLNTKAEWAATSMLHPCTPSPSDRPMSSMPPMHGDYYLQSPRKENALTQPGCSTSRVSYTKPPPKCVFLPNVQSSSPPVCHCGSEAGRGTESLSLSVFFKAKRINGLPVLPSLALCTTRLLCLVVDLMLLTSIF